MTVDAGQGGDLRAARRAGDRRLAHRGLADQARRHRRRPRLQRGRRAVEPAGADRRPRPAAGRHGADPQRRAGGHRGGGGRARRPGRGGRLAGQHARPQRRRAGSRPPGDDRGAARRGAGAAGDEYSPSSTGSARSASGSRRTDRPPQQAPAGGPRRPWPGGIVGRVARSSSEVGRWPVRPGRRWRVSAPRGGAAWASGAFARPGWTSAPFVWAVSRS